jgi:hypothetical protein
VTTTKWVVDLAIAALVAYDFWCAFKGWPTISATLRQMNQETNWLVGWLLAGLWLHVFLVDFLRLFR